MDTFFNIITHILIIVGLISMMFFISKIIKSEIEANTIEGLILICTTVFSLFIYFASKGFNISIPNLLFESLNESDTFSIRILFGSILTASVGVLLSWYITNQLEKNTIFGTRIVILFSTLMIVLFGDVYISSFNINSFSNVNKTLLPNVTFVIGILGYVIFKYNPNK